MNSEVPKTQSLKFLLWTKSYFFGIFNNCEKNSALRDQKWDPSITNEIGVMVGGCVDLCTDQEEFEWPACSDVSPCELGKCSNGQCREMTGRCKRKCLEKR